VEPVRDPSEAQECGARVEDVPYSAPAPDPLPDQRSRIGVEVRAALAALERALGSRVPVTLAAERRRPVGAPGEVSYVVRRGRFGIGLVSERLTVAVPVEVEAEVCKPLGPFCPTYGRCSPRLSAVASVPALLSESYEIGRSRVAIAVTRPCTIAGIDATPQIREQALRQAGGVQGRIDASLPAIRPSVAGIWELLHHPISLGRSTCLRIRPDRITQQRPTLKERTLVSRLGAEGTLVVEDPCNAQETVRVAPLPRLLTEEGTSDGIALRVPVRTSWSDVSAALTRSLSTRSGAREPLRVSKLEAQGVVVGSRSLVLLRATLSGHTCGPVRVLGEPWYDAATGRVRLRDVRPAPGAPAVRGLGAVLARIARDAAIELPVEVAAGPAALGELVQRFGRDLPEGVEIESDLRPAAVERVAPEPDGLAAVAVLAGRATVSVK
jgi:hypothetical protein